MRIELGLEVESSKSFTNQLFASNYWHYAKQCLKGAGVFTVGLAGYFLLKRGYENVASKGESTLHNKALVSRDNQQSIKQLSVFSSANQHAKDNAINLQQSTVAQQSLVTGGQSKSQETFDIRYPVKQRIQTTDKNVLTTQVNQHTPLRKRDIGDEFLVNTYVTNDQEYPAVAALPNGNFIVTWSGSGLGDSSGVYGQLFDESANQVGSEFQVNTVTTNSQWNPSVAAFSNGNFVVTWDSMDQDGDAQGVYGQLFDGTGNALGNEFQVNTYTTSTQSQPSVAALSNGNFVVTWYSWGQDGDGSAGIYGQLFNELGNTVDSEFQVNTYTTGWQGSPSVAAFSNGNFLVTWGSQDGDLWGIYGQLFNGSGNKTGNEFQVNTYTMNNQLGPSVATFSNGNFVVTWQSRDQDGSDWGVYGQLFDGSGDNVGSEFQINTSTIGGQQGSTVTRLSNDELVVCWGGDGQDGSLSGVYCQLFDGSGDSVGSEFQTNIYTIDLQSSPSVAALLNEDFVVVWSSFSQDGDDWGIYGRLFHKEIYVRNVNTDRLYTEDEAYSFSKDPIVIEIFFNPAIIDVYFKLSDINAGTLIPSTIGLTTSTFNNTGVWQASGAFADVDTLLANLQFQPATDYSSNFSISIFVSDGISPNFNDQWLMQAIPVNDMPRLINNRLTLEVGETVLIRSNNLNATDVDNQDKTLTFLITEFQDGHFERTSDPEKIITTFTQQEIIDQAIQFKHDGGLTAPLYKVSVSDGEFITQSVLAEITFTANARKNVVAPVVGTIVSVAVVGAIAGVGFWHYRTNRTNKQYRNQYPLANKLYEKLHLHHLDNFESEVGQEFITTVSQLKTLFSEKHQLEVDNMATDAIDEFSTYVAKAINMHVTVEKTRFGGQRLDMADVKSKAERIVNSVQTVIEQDGWVPRQGPVTEKFDL